jgi:hypothetical protein
MSVSGKTIVFTGTLAMPRNDAKAMAETAGAKVTGSVTGSTDILVCGSGVGAKKTDDAAKKGVEVWSEEQFHAALAGGKKPAAKKPAAKKPVAGEKKKAEAPAEGDKPAKAAKKAAAVPKKAAVPTKAVSKKAAAVPKKAAVPTKAVLKKAAAVPATSPSARKPDRGAGGHLSVVEDYDTKLMQTNIGGGKNNNKSTSCRSCTTKQQGPTTPGTAGVAWARKVPSR